MTITENLKKWLIDNCDVKADATDDELKKAVADAMVSGTDLTAEKYFELTQTTEDETVNEFDAKFASITDSIKQLTDHMVAKDTKEDKDAEDAETKTADEAKLAKASKMLEDAMEKMEADKKEAGKTSEAQKTSPSKFAKMIAANGGGIESDSDTLDVRVKEAAESYNSTTKTMLYPNFSEKSGKAHSQAGQPLMDNGHTINETSELDEAVIGAYCKYVCASAQRNGSKSAGFQALPQHDKELMLYAMKNMKWGGIGPEGSDDDGKATICRRKLTELEQKALIDDATSGGTEAAPIVFDDRVIQAPLLNGELYPLVTTYPLERGRRVEGVSLSQVTSSWGGVDGTAISLFNTASYVSAFDTTIFRWEGAIEIGLDFLSDTPINFGQIITTQYGEQLLEDLDDVIAAGDGTTQPEGIIVKSGTTSVAWGGATSLGNYESLRFGVAKAEHRKAVKSSAVFCGTETSYQRARAIPVGTNDARRLGGMTYDSYNWMERPYKINESLTNAQIFYSILARYRMYRRHGLVMRSSTEGSTLMRSNVLLMIATARYGGQLERGATTAVTTTAPA